MAKYKLSPKDKVEWVEDGDQSFKPRKSSGTTEAENWQVGIDEIVAFLESLRESKRRKKAP